MSIANYLKATITSGFVFLVPILIILYAIVKLELWVREIIMPLAHQLPIDNIVGTGIPVLMSIATILIVCLLAGLIAKTYRGKKFVDWLEAKLLSNIPGYSAIKTMGESMVGTEENKAQEVVLLCNEDAWQVGFITERLDNGMIAVFVPDAPSPLSGNLFFVTSDKIIKINLTASEAYAIIKQIGKGSNKVVKDRFVVK